MHWVFVAVRALSGCSSELGLLFSAGCRLLILAASLGAELRLQGAGSVLVAQGLNFPTACGAREDRTRVCCIGRQSYLLDYQESPSSWLLTALPILSQTDPGVSEFCRQHHWLKLDSYLHRYTASQPALMMEFNRLKYWCLRTHSLSILYYLLASWNYYTVFHICPVVSLNPWNYRSGYQCILPNHGKAVNDYRPRYLGGFWDYFCNKTSVVVSSKHPVKCLIRSSIHIYCVELSQSPSANFGLSKLFGVFLTDLSLHCVFS